MFQQQAMDKNVAATHFLQENPLSCVVQKSSVVPRDAALAEKNEAEDTMLGAGFTTAER